MFQLFEKLIIIVYIYIGDLKVQNGWAFISGRHSHLVAFMDLMFQPSLKRLGNKTYFLE